jgi:acyl-coenzyme A thioesterase PaaI-like protein
MNDIPSRTHPPDHHSEPPPSQATLDRIRASEHPGCLMCSPSNPFGMKLRFKVQPDGSVLALFPCRDMLQSYPMTLHGGVISAVLDSAMTNALFAIGVVASTAEMTVRFAAPVNLDHGAVVTATITDANAYPLYHARSELIQDRKVVAHATAKFWDRSYRF